MRTERPEGLEPPGGRPALAGGLAPALGIRWWRGRPGQLVVDSVCDRGPRSENQDACEIRTLSGGRLVIAGADGVSGARRGGEAAPRAAFQVAEAVAALAGRWTPEALREIVLEANRTLLQAEPGGQYQTTLVVLAIDPQERRGFCLSSGDSWAAHLNPKDGSLCRLTLSHGEAARLEREGAAGPLGAWIRAGSATRGLGYEQQPPVEVESFEVRPGDRFVVATDGLEVLQEREIASLLGRSRPASAAKKLFQQARRRGLKDNVTVATVSVAPHRIRRPAGFVARGLRWVPALALALALSSLLALDAGWAALPAAVGPGARNAALAPVGPAARLTATPAPSPTPIATRLPAYPLPLEYPEATATGEGAPRLGAVPTATPEPEEVADAAMEEELNP